MMKENTNQVNGKSVAWTIPARIRCLKWILLGSILSQLLLGHCIGQDVWEEPPPGQPAQMWSKVRYDPKLTDPFFQSNEWSYAHCIIPLPDGRFEDESRSGRIVHNPPRLKHTAKCISTSKGDTNGHAVRFCEARLIGPHGIDLLIHEDNPPEHDALRILIRNGKFTSQFWTLYLGGPTEGLIWTTKRQKLALDKKAHRKGDVIKGRIDVEILDELINPKYPNRPPRPITFKGVFKTVVR